DHADFMDGEQPRRKAVDGVGRSRRIESSSRGFKAPFDPLRERRPFGPAMDILDYQPWRDDLVGLVDEGQRAGVDEADHERRRWPPLIEPPERDRLFLDDERGSLPGAPYKRRTEHLDDDRHLAVGGDSERIEDHAHPAPPDPPDQPVSNP